MSYNEHQEHAFIGFKHPFPSTPPSNTFGQSRIFIYWFGYKRGALKCSTVTAREILHIWETLSLLPYFCE